MTKTLTEQWREGTLPKGNYYIVITGITEKKQIMIDYYIPELHHFEIKPSDCILEVLAPVPSYDELKRLQEQLKEANEVIKHYANDENWCDYYDDDDEKMTKAIYIDCNGALKASLYLKKWGVK